MNEADVVVKNNVDIDGVVISEKNDDDDDDDDDDER
jgi:hypothetical protein